jgi:pimeloyl-ACP methyl ester carboxylesterase
MLNLAETLSRPGCELRYADLPGRAPAVVFLHGAGADSATFEAQARGVNATGRRVILVDLRGHGRSRPNSIPLTPQLLIDDVEALAPDGAILVGHSLGGNLVQALVRRSPGRYSALAVLDATWNTGPLSALERALLRLAAPGLALLPARRLPAVMAKASAVTDAARADAERAFSQLSKREFLQVWRATVAFVQPDPEYRTPVPLLLVRGADDATGNIARAMPAWAASEGVLEHVVPNAGHLVTQDAPGAVDDMLLTFLEAL